MLLTLVWPLYRQVKRGRGRGTPVISNEDERGSVRRYRHAVLASSLGSFTRRRWSVYTACLVVIVLGTVCSSASAAAPMVGGEFASYVSASTAKLGASVNPNGVATRFYFRYGTSIAYGSQLPGAPGGLIGAGEPEVAVGPVQLQGLQAATVYHYRVVAKSEPSPGEVLEATGEDQTFRTSAAEVPVLLDGRRWELVSPPAKNGALIEGIGQEGVIQAAADGASIAYHVDSPTEDEPAGYANQVEVLSARGNSGWATQDLAIPHPSATGKSEGVGEDYRFFSEDLAHAVVQPAGAFVPLSDEASEQTPYLRANFLAGSGGICSVWSGAGSCFTPLVTGAPGFANVPPGTVFGQLGNQGGEVGPCPSNTAVCGPEFEGASADASHVVISTSNVPVDLTSTPAPEGGLYEWSAGKLLLISLLPSSEGEAPATSPQLGATNFDARNAISSDGSRIFWIGHGSSNHLYMRDVARGETVELDAGLPGVPRYQVAAADGSRAFFTDEGTLYECAMVVEEGESVCDRSMIAEAVQGTVMGASEDGSWVYFVSDSALSPGSSAGNCEQNNSPPEASCNLYVRHEGETKLVAVIAGEDSPDWGKEAEPGDLHQLTARVSPNGLYLAFMSQRSLTGYDNTDVVSGAHDQEVFIYDAGSEAVHCVSCNPTQARPVGESYGEKAKLVGGASVWPSETVLAANVPGWTPYALDVARYQSRYLGDNGRLFFNSRDSLVPRDTNDGWDVYEYEPRGVGSCNEGEVTYDAGSEGCVNLVSSGTAAGESAFLDASATGGRTGEGAEGGGDVFFLTNESLSPQDFDAGVDLYDARECQPVAACPDSALSEQPSCNTGESCKAAPSPQPGVFGAPPSALMPGTGNISATSTTPKRKALSQAQLRAKKLAAALRLCHKERAKSKRKICEAHARKIYRAKNAKEPAQARRRGK